MPKQLGCFIKEARSHIKEWDAESAHENLQAGDVLVVDVREADEFGQGHLQGAINIPRGILEGAADLTYKYRDPRLCNARDQTILLYCQSGGRSAMAAWVLQQMGFEHVYNMAGGLECWEAEGLELES
jgi:rhodanese-related sulfurtransferase